MSTRIGFDGMCTASNKLAPTYINGTKYCHYDCSLKFGDIDKPQAWNKQPIQLNPFFDIGTTSQEPFDFNSQVCIGQHSERDPEFEGTVVPKVINRPFAVSSQDTQAPVARVIHKTFNNIQ